MRESLNCSPNTLTESSAVRRILNPYLYLCCISPQMKRTMYRAQADAYGPFLIASSRATLDP